MITSNLAEQQQLLVEQTYSEHFVDPKIKEALAGIEENVEHHKKAVEALSVWLGQEHYPEKQERLLKLKCLDLEELVTDILVGIAYCHTPELFVSVTAQLANRLKFEEKRDSIQTIAEMVAVMGHLDAFDIYKPHTRARLRIQSNLVIPDEIIEFVIRSKYLPPMICPPEELSDNYSSPYLTHDSCLILGKYNGHDGDICLDTINTQNSVALSLNTEFLNTVEELPKNPLESLEQQEQQKQQEQWDKFLKESQDTYNLIKETGNKFYMLNKVDKRGRMYSQGYHINPQGSSYKKAMIELAEPEVVTGLIL